jgi:hypothetical protein
MRKQARLPAIMWVCKPRPAQTAVPACSSSPIPAVAQRLAPPAALAPDQCCDLLGYLAQIADPRHPRCRRHPLVGGLGVAVCAVLAGARSLAAIGEWASDAPGPGPDRAREPCDPWTGAWEPPAEATVGRVLGRVDPDALDRAIGAWLAGQQPSSPAPRPPPAPARRAGRAQSTGRPCVAAATTANRRSACSP